jgi:hypothetical protein
MLWCPNPLYDSNAKENDSIPIEMRNPMASNEAIKPAFLTTCPNPAIDGQMAAQQNFEGDTHQYFHLLHSGFLSSKSLTDG